MTKRPYSFTKSDKVKKMVSIRLDPRTRGVFAAINELLVCEGLPTMSQSEIIELAVDDFFENLPAKLQKAK